MPDRHEQTAVQGAAFGGRPIELSSGSLTVRQARNQAEVDAALALRYRVFYDEMQARPSAEAAATKRDTDEFDPFCEHLLIIDRDRGDGPEGVVATYRMMRRSGAEQVGRFYTADEYDIAGLIAQDGEILEMGRSCVAADYRTRAVMQLMWRGVTAYVVENSITFLFGCASFHGTDPAAFALPLSYLHHNHLAPAPWCPVAVKGRYESMNLLPPEDVDTRRALRILPPIIKGYLRLNGHVGDGAVIDHEFNTVDICVVVKMDDVSEKYLKHFMRDLPNGSGEAEE